MGATMRKVRRITINPEIPDRFVNKSCIFPWLVHRRQWLSVWVVLPINMYHPQYTCRSCLFWVRNMLKAVLLRNAWVARYFLNMTRMTTGYIENAEFRLTMSRNISFVPFVVPAVRWPVNFESPEEMFS